MTLIRINTKPTRTQLHVFGAAWLVFLGLAGAVVLRRTGSAPAAAAIWAAAVAGPAASWLAPGVFRIVYVGLAYAAWPIGVVVSVAVLMVVYYLVLTPIGLVMRLLGRDTMGRTFPSADRSHWLPRPHGPEADVRRYFRQF